MDSASTYMICLPIQISAHHSRYCLQHSFHGQLELTHQKLYYFGEILYYVCVAVTKIAILLLYIRIAAGNTLRTLIKIMMAFTVLSALGCVLASIFQCTPIHKAWAVSPNVLGKCINVSALFYAQAGLDIVQDCIIYVLPMRMLYQIQIPRRQKIALMFVFAIGGFVVVTGSKDPFSCSESWSLSMGAVLGFLNEISFIFQRIGLLAHGETRTNMW
jgi:hypothetical protein